MWLRAVRKINVRALASAANPPLRATLFKGDGVGPEIADAVTLVLRTAGVAVEWDEQVVQHDKLDPRTNSFISRENLDSVKRNGIGLKGPMMTPVGKGFRSLNLTLRKELDLFANVRPCVSIPGYPTPYENVDLVTIRENTEGEYSGLEHMVVSGVAESLKVHPTTTHQDLHLYVHRSSHVQRACELPNMHLKCVLTSSFGLSNSAHSTPWCAKATHYSTVPLVTLTITQDNGRKRVTAIHKANIMKLSDGLFLTCCREVAGAHTRLFQLDGNVTRGRRKIPNCKV